MKKILTLLCLSILLLAIGTTAQSQFMFSVRPQILGLDGAAFGYKFPGDVAVYGGIDYLHFGATIECTGRSTSSSPRWGDGSSSTGTTTRCGKSSQTTRSRRSWVRTSSVTARRI